MRWFALLLLLPGCASDTTDLSRSVVFIVEDALRHEVEALIEGPDYRHAHWGILVADLETGATVLDINADKLFAPASVTKLFSVACALDAFGADHRFETVVKRRGGDLVLVAGGDLTLGGRTTADGRIAFKDNDHTYANGNTKGALTEPDPLAGLNELARQVAAAGIRKVEGDVVVDDRLFDRAEGTGSGPSRLTPILVNDNLIDFLVTPARAGERARVDVRPACNLYAIDAQVETVAKGEALRFDLMTPGPGRIVVRGRIPEGHTPLLRVHEVEDAREFARALFLEALKRAGVEVEVATPRTTPRLPERAALAALPTVARLVSPPFSENARLILKVSHNLHASTLPLLVAAKHGKRTLGDGLRLQHAFLQRIGVEADTISFGGGAGGSRADYATPRATVQLLRHMATRPDFAAYESALPVLGVDGTLAETVPAASPARGKVRAKTGTFFWHNALNDRFLLTSKALAGYIDAKSGRKLAFAMFVNLTHLATPGDTAREGKVLGRLAEIVQARE